MKSIDFMLHAFGVSQTNPDKEVCALGTKCTDFVASRLGRGIRFGVHVEANYQIDRVCEGPTEISKACTSEPR